MKKSTNWARGIDQARAAVQRNEWQLAVRALTEAQDRIGRLLKEIGDKGRDVMLAPKQDQGDRGYENAFPVVARVADLVYGSALRP